MSTSDIVQLTVIVSSSALSRRSFGNILGLVGKVPVGWGLDKVRAFSRTTELTDLGFAAADPASKIASLIKSQVPCPRNFKLAKRTTPAAQSIALKVVSAAVGDKYRIEVGSNAGATTVLEYTALAAPTPTIVATALELLVDGVTGVTSVASTDTITITPETPGDLVNLKGWTSNLEVTDNTPDAGIANDLSACAVFDDDFFGVVLDSQSKAEILAAAAWCEANDRMLFVNSADAACKTSATTDVISALKTLGYKNTVILFDNDELLGYSGAAWASRGLAFDPGSLTFAFKDLSGVTVDKLTTGEQTFIEGKNGNYYVSHRGKSITYQGKASSGQYADITHFLAWLRDEMDLQVFDTISRAAKLPYTNAGLGAIEGTIWAVLRRGARMGGLIDDENMTVKMPTLDEIDAVTRSNRLIPDIEFGAILAGAAHGARLVGTVRTG